MPRKVVQQKSSLDRVWACGSLAQIKLGVTGNPGAMGAAVWEETKKLLYSSRTLESLEAELAGLVPPEKSSWRNFVSAFTREQGD